MDEEEFDGEAETDTETVEDFLPSYPWSKAATVTAVLTYAAELQMASANFFVSLVSDAAASHNFAVDKKTMHEEVSKQIETLPTFKQPKE